MRTPGQESRPTLHQPWYGKPHLAFAAIACVFGLAFALTLPSLGGFDEAVHFLRAWNVSNGHAAAQTGYRANDPALDLGAYVPAGLQHQLGAILVDGILQPDNARGSWSHVGDAAPAGRPTFVDFSAAAVYPPVPYIPSAIGIRAGRLFGASAWDLVLLARLAELAAFATLVALAIRRLPSRRWVLAVIALTPVALFQAATVSADAITTALALLVIADAFALAAQPVGAVPRGLVVETALATVGLALCKQPYLLVAGLLLLPAWRHRRQIGAVIGGALAVSGGVALAWAHWANDHYLAPDFLPPSLGGHANYANNNVKPSAQLTYLRSHPLAFGGAVVRTVTYHGVSIVHDAVAQVSYWHVPGLIAVLIGCGLIAVVAFDIGPLPGGRAMRALALALAAVTVAISLFLAYVGWNAVKAPRIDGYQGRYLVVILGLVAIAALPDRMRFNLRFPPGWLLGWSAAMLLAVEVGLAWHSYG